MDGKKEENGLESSKGTTLIIQTHDDEGGDKPMLTNSRQTVKEKLTCGTAWKVKSKKAEDPRLVLKCNFFSLSYREVK